jgi:lipoprotein-releasing system permease protein
MVTVVQKSKQIGILKAMGIKDRQSSLIFLFEGFLLGIMGTVIGVALGLGLSFSFSTFVKNPDGTPLIELYINYKFIGLSAFVALLASTIAALIPARGSSKLNPIEVIRNA